jgi:hypothetical protein
MRTRGEQDGIRVTGKPTANVGGYGAGFVFGKLKRRKVMTNGIAFEVEESLQTGAAEQRDPKQILLDLYRAYELENEVDPDLWPWESKRWHELAFCLLVTSAPSLSPQSVREAIRVLADWRLLDIHTLASFDMAHPEVKIGEPILVTIRTFLQQAGFTLGEATKAVTALTEAAWAFEQQYEGRVQKFYREHGVGMIEALEKQIRLSAFTAAEARQAFSIWLQNTLNLPIPLSTPVLEKVAHKVGTGYSDLVQAADELDVNVALLDEALLAFEEDMTEAEEDKG